MKSTSKTDETKTENSTNEIETKKICSCNCCTNAEKNHAKDLERLLVLEENYDTLCEELSNVLDKKDELKIENKRLAKELESVIKSCHRDKTELQKLRSWKTTHLDEYLESLEEITKMREEKNRALKAKELQKDMYEQKIKELKKEHDEKIENSESYFHHELERLRNEKS